MIVISSLDLDKQILDAFQASSIILVFVTILFSIRYPKIIEEINKEEIPTGDLAKKREKKRLIQVFMLNCFPLVFILIWCSYLFIPMFITVINNTKINLFHFGFLPTAFVFVVFWVWFLFIWSFWLSCFLYKKISSIKV